MEIACLVITHLGMKYELWRRPALSDRNVILHVSDSDYKVSVSKRKSLKPKVFDTSRGIMGIPVGMPIPLAVSKYPDAVLLKADIQRYKKIFGRVISNLEKISPSVEEDGLGKAYLDMTSLGHLYGGDAKVVSRILDAVPDFLQPRVGIAEGKFTAYLAAANSQQGRASKAPKGAVEVTNFLSPFSVDMLPVSWKTIVALHRFGIHTMGDIVAHEIGSLQARFGYEGGRAWKLSQGISTDIIVTPKRECVISEYVSLPFASSSREVLFAATDTLLRRAYARTGLKGRYANSFSLVCSITGDSVWSKEVIVKEPSGSASSASFSLRSILAEVDLPGPIEDVTLVVSDFTGEHGRQARAFSNVREDTKERMGRLVRMDHHLQVKNRSANSLYQVVNIDLDHPVPEMRSVQVSIDPESTDVVRNLNLPERIDVEESGGIPVSISFIRKEHGSIKVKAVDMWKMDLWWMAIPIRRIYFLLMSENYGPFTVFKDESRGGEYINGSNERAFFTKYCWYRQSY